ncbi:hypothetical protein P4U43_00435 [Arthrobacter sp. EH-1B-1]|uniref:T3SS peptide-binding chaperone domain-containing protein n=1 Tax=Arthrobacter vasquezii TaxID=2977629 RepID=A0ABT6CRI5_9MICC|nr:hypothetical protein [Arthrobacter vasquezii]MDF9276255.1 hypothetical protein [Arthrobacter vasquezii]
MASELTRRDSSVYIGLTGEGGSAAHSDALMLAKHGDVTYQARRCGLGFTARKFQLPWNRALSMENPREIAIALENALGLHLPKKSPPTSARAIGYRVLAAILETTVGDPQYWSISEASGGPFDPDSPWTRERSHQWESTRWSLWRDGEIVAELDNFGSLKIDGRTIDVLKRYRELDGRLHALVVDIFGKYIP